MEILNVMAYLMKKPPTVMWREEEFRFSVFRFYVYFLSPIFPFTPSPILSLKKEGKTVSGEKAGAIFFLIFGKEIIQVQKVLPRKSPHEKYLSFSD